MDNPTTTLLENAEPESAASLLDGWMKAGWGKLTAGNILSALALLLVCLAAGRGLLRLADRLMSRSGMDGRMKSYALRGIKALLYILTALIVAGSLGVDVTSLIAVVSVFGLAVSLAVQDVLSNVAGGMVLLGMGQGDLRHLPFTLSGGDIVSQGEGL